MPLKNIIKTLEYNNNDINLYDEEELKEYRRIKVRKPREKKFNYSSKQEQSSYGSRSKRK